jgi:hypothetical protein
MISYWSFHNLDPKNYSTTVKIMLLLRLSTKSFSGVGGVEVKTYALYTSELHGVSDQLHCSAALTPGKEFRYPLDGRLDGSLLKVWTR